MGFKKYTIGLCDLYLGDCRNVSPFIEAADLVLTDPPYKNISGGAICAEGYGWSVSVLKGNKGQLFQHNDMNPLEIAKEISFLAKEDSDIYVMTNNFNLSWFLNAFEAEKLKFHGLLVWRKNTCTANRWYMKEMELVLYYYKGRARVINRPGSKQIFETENPRLKSHPTEKPVSLMYEYITNSTDEGQLVIDPFMGTGSTGIACIQSGRRFIGIEKDKQYFDIAVKRVRQAHQEIERRKKNG